MSVGAVTGPQVAPALWRRMACFVYEGLLLFAIGLIPGALGAVLKALTGQSHDLVLQVFTFLLYGAYFTWYWSKRGQTLPMQTWHIRVLTNEGVPVPRGRAALRYLLAWVWVLPAVILGHWVGWTGWGLLSAVLAGTVVYAASSLAHPRKQFWHDALSGTQLVTHRPTATAPARGAR